MLAIATIAFALMAICVAIMAIVGFLGCWFGDSRYNHFPNTPDGAREYYIPIQWYEALCPGSFDRLR